MFPKISIVIPSFNQGSFIEDTLLSVISQNYPNLELIVIDGGSTDQTVDILKKFNPEIFYWVSEPDHGQTHALVKGFEMATGEIFGWLCSDDLHEPNTLKDVANYFCSHPKARVVYGDCSLIDFYGKPVRPLREIPFNRFIWLYSHNYIPQPSTFWKANLYSKVGGLDLGFEIAMDGDLWIRFAKETEIHHLGKFLSRFRKYPEQKNFAFREITTQEYDRIRRGIIGSESKTKRKILSYFAKSVRIIWKLSTGKYFWGRSKPDFAYPSIPHPNFKNY